MDAPDSRRIAWKGLQSRFAIGAAFLTSSILALGVVPAHASVDLTCGLRASGCYGHNGGTSIYVGPVGTYKVRGAIRDHWGARGWENSSLGFPYSNEFCGLRSGVVAPGSSGVNQSCTGVHRRLPAS
ncbi:LGFP repeat-containing protein [Mariniluteicoccus endophyticus]